MEDKDLGRTMKAAHAVDQENMGNIVKAQELLMVSPGNRKVLSKAARKALNIMLEYAAGSAWEDRVHVLPKSELRGNHKSNEHVDTIIDELRHTSLYFDVLSPRKKRANTAFPLLASSTKEEDGNGLFYFTFSPEVRQMLRNSQYYALLNSKAVYAIESRYSMVLYEIGCQFLARPGHPSLTINIQQFRELFNVLDGKLTRWFDLKKNVLDVAIKEVNALSHMHVSCEIHKKGRKVIGLKLQFFDRGNEGEMQAAELLRLTRNERRAKVNKLNRETRLSSVQEKQVEDMNAEAEKYFPKKTQISLDLEGQ